MSTKTLWLTFADSRTNKLDSSHCWSQAPQSSGPLVAHPPEDVCQTLGSAGERANAEGYVRRISFFMGEGAGSMLRRLCAVGHRPSQLSLATMWVFSVGYLVLIQASSASLTPRNDSESLGRGGGEEGITPYQ